MLTIQQIQYAKVGDPPVGLPATEPQLPDSLYQFRLEKVLNAMRQRQLEWLLIYADREHYWNFEYLTGFGPRFEEALLLLRQSGEAAVLLGNECYPMHRYCRIPAKGILHQALSLPNQPVDKLKDLADILRGEGVAPGHKIGLVGWKLFTPYNKSRQCFDMPAFLVDHAAKTVGAENLENATDLFIHPEYGVRVCNTAEDIAYFEYGAAWASDAVRRLLQHLRTGITEVELSRMMNSGGMPLTCHTMASSGAQVDKGLVSPTTNEVRLGDPFTCSQGIPGGLSCRAGFVAYSQEDLPQGAEDYLDVLAKPYYAAIANWYEALGIGVTGGEIYDVIQRVFPKETYGWILNPGHLVATEEWMSSPIYPGSDIALRSGTCIQMDIIPSLGGAYAGANCEDGVAIADEQLREEIRLHHPDVWDRIQIRRAHMAEVLGIRLKPEILPLSNLAATWRPYLLNKDCALVVKR